MAWLALLNKKGVVTMNHSSLGIVRIGQWVWIVFFLAAAFLAHAQPYWLGKVTMTYKGELLSPTTAKIYIFNLPKGVYIPILAAQIMMPLVILHAMLLKSRVLSLNMLSTACFALALFNLMILAHVVISYYKAFPKGQIGMGGIILLASLFCGLIASLHISLQCGPLFSRRSSNPMKPTAL